MKNNLSDLGFYFITDSRLSRKGIFSDTEAALRAGCRIIQYREKEKSTRDLIAEAKKIKELCQGKAFLIINDRVDVALAVDADGVHLGQEDMDLKTARKLLGEKIIGVTVHNLKEALEAEQGGADYLGLSPICHTDTKKDAGCACGLGLLKEIRPKVSVPIVGIGGITKEYAPEVIKAGADSVAAISATVAKPDVEKEVRDFMDLVRRNRA